MATRRVTWAAHTRTFRALDLVFDVASTDETVVALLDHAFGTLPLADEPAPGKVRFGMAAEPRKFRERWQPYRLSRDGRSVAYTRAGHLAVSQLLWLVNDSVARAAHDRLLVHGALLAGDGDGGAGASVMLAGPSGCGKSTLSALLAAAGARFGTDEMVAFAADSDALDCFRRPLVLKPEGREALAGAVPEPAREIAGFVRAKWPVPATDLGAQVLDAVPPLRGIVFPAFVPGAPTTVTSVSRADAVTRLVEGAWHARRHGRVLFRRMVEVVRGCDALLAIEYGDARDAATRIAEASGFGHAP